MNFCAKNPPLRQAANRYAAFIMKLGLTIIFLGLVTGLNAQSLTDIEKRLRFLEKSAPLTYDTTGFSTLPKVKYLCDEHFDAYEFPENKKTEDYYHVVDLNNDGLKDLIYSGPCLPYDQTGIFLNDGKSLKLIHGYPGEVVSLEKSIDKTTINILKKSCCCDYYSDYIQVTIWNDSRVDKHQITFFGNPEIKIDKVTELKTKGVLRTSPEVNDIKKKDDCSDQIMEGNHLTRIDKITTVVQLSQSGQWKLVLYSVDKENSYIGWIK
ncbi:hypothetical protein JCM31826_04300 [Thermaurantimonas aggregans]|uniref:Uncharacterized protein n=1 Tax=Thermaurantimonas aggregans TaxID=2173829 RepID=A0A401XIY1_9FLAO|nr:hypothetical protein [Thermaurantimonas aggregans]GCD76948.1 hypothetical protein JCM31826_04300 [Thermaurantimonas aggregans]